jgi:hypothetical protein
MASALAPVPVARRPRRMRRWGAVCLRATGASARRCVSARESRLRVVARHQPAVVRAQAPEFELEAWSSLARQRKASRMPEWGTDMQALPNKIDNGSNKYSFVQSMLRYHTCCHRSNTRLECLNLPLLSQKASIPTPAARPRSSVGACCCLCRLRLCCSCSPSSRCPCSTSSLGRSSLPAGRRERVASLAQRPPRHPRREPRTASDRQPPGTRGEGGGRGSWCVADLSRRLVPVLVLPLIPEAASRSCLCLRASHCPGLTSPSVPP